MRTWSFSTTLGASPGALIGLSEGREAANPFGKVKTPIDAYCACLIDRDFPGSLTDSSGGIRWRATAGGNGRAAATS